MTEYIPTDTDISELGDYQDDYNSLLAKCGILSTENEILKKQLKDEIFERDNRIQHLIFENERFKSSLESANNLLTFFQSQDNSKYKKINEQLSTKNFDLEQTNHFLKRENFSLKSDLEEIKIELDKIKALKASQQNFEYSVYSTYQGSKGLETEGNDLYNHYVNTETLGSNGVLPAEGRGSVLKCSNNSYLRNELQQAKAAEDLNAFGPGKSNLIENAKMNKSSNLYRNDNNLNNYDINNEEEKYMVDEKLTENDFLVPNNDNMNNNLTVENKNLSNNNNINNLNFNNNIRKISQESNNNNNNNNNLDDSCDSSAEEISNMNIEELKSFIKKVKKESKDFYKKALDMLTENEFEIMKLKSENEHLKESSNANSLSNESNQRNSINKNQIKMRKSILSESNNESVDLNLQALIDEIEVLKRETIEKQSEFESEKSELSHKLSQMEINHKLIVSDYENEIYKLRYEIENLEIEKNILEKDINKENHERSNLAENLEHYNEIIRNLEEQKDKSENNHRNLMENLMSEKKKLEKIILENLETIHKLESDVKTIKESEARSNKELTDNFKKEKQAFERELIELRGNNGVLSKEKELLRKELEATKASYKNAKVQISDLSLENSKLKESKNDEVKKLTSKLDENLEELNNKFHNEKLSMQEKIKELLSVIDEKGINLQEKESLTLQNIEVSKRSGRSSINNENAVSERKDSSSLITSFNFETLNKEIENLKSKNFKLQVEINTLNNKLKIKENKIANTIRLKTEIDALKKEKSKYKADMLELKKLYEEQINQLLEKLNSANSQNNTNNNANNENDKTNENNSVCNNNENFDRESLEELKETILRLNYEKRFLQDQVSILNKELENMEKLKNDYIKKLKDDLEHTEDIAACAKLSVAQISFEKETELVKYKKYCKKLKMKMQSLQPILNAENHNNIGSPDKSRIGVGSLAAQYTTNSSAKKSLSDFSLANSLNSNGCISARVNHNDYGTNVASDNNKKGFFDKLFNK